jgi:hypothetical protein
VDASDLLPPNLLIDDGRLGAVIDFGGVGDGTWERGRGWALSIALLIIPYFPDTNPAFVAMATRMVDEIVGDVAKGASRA